MKPLEFEVEGGGGAGGAEDFWGEQWGFVVVNRI